MVRSLDYRWAILCLILGIGWSAWLAPACLAQEQEQKQEQKQQQQEQKQQQGQAFVVEAIEDDEGEDAEGGAVQVVMVNPFGFDTRKMSAAKRFQLSQVLQVEIELIERICEPTPQQMTKLRIASKGAVKKMTEEWIKNSNQGIRIVAADQVLVDNDEDNGQEERDTDRELENTSDDEEQEIKHADEIDPNLAQWIMMDRFGNPFKTLHPQDNPIWTKLVNGILSAEQAQQLADFKSAQQAQKVEDLLNIFIALAVRELSLTTEQQSELKKILKPHFANKNLSVSSLYEPYLSFWYASKATDKELSKTLSPAQIQAMRLLLLPAKQIGPVLEAENDGGIMIEVENGNDDE